MDLPGRWCPSVSSLLRRYFSSINPILHSYLVTWKYPVLTGCIGKNDFTFKYAILCKQHGLWEVTHRAETQVYKLHCFTCEQHNLGWKPALGKKLLTLEMVSLAGRSGHPTLLIKTRSFLLRRVWLWKKSNKLKFIVGQEGRHRGASCTVCMFPPQPKKTTDHQVISIERTGSTLHISNFEILKV